MAETERLCAREGCGRPVPAGKPANVKYCCPVCGQKAANARRRQDPLPDRQCPVCKQEFSPRAENHVYCTEACQYTAFNEARREQRALTGNELFEFRENINIETISDVKEGEFTLYLGDGHGKFRDRPLDDAINRVIVDFQPDRIIYGGDHVVDFYEISVFDKNPTRRFHLQEEIDEGKSSLDFHGTIAPQAKRIYLGGNHEDRFRRYMWRHPELAPLRRKDNNAALLSVESLLDLEERGIRYIPFPGRLDIAGFIVTHGPGGQRAGLQMKHVAKWMSEYIRSSGCCFHFHRQQSFGFNNDQGLPQTFYAIGCTCRLDPDYNPFPEWQQGFGYSRVLDGKVRFTSVSVFGRAFLVEGKAYRY